MGEGFESRDLLIHIRDGCPRFTIDGNLRFLGPVLGEFRKRPEFRLVHSRDAAGARFAVRRRLKDLDSIAFS